VAVLQPLNYLVKFDTETGLYLARTADQPLVHGEGKCLYSAIDDLEAKLSHAIVGADHLDVRFRVEENRKDRIELSAKVSITV